MTMSEDLVFRRLFLTPLQVSIAKIKESHPVHLLTCRCAKAKISACSSVYTWPCRAHRKNWSNLRLSSLPPLAPAQVSRQRKFRTGQPSHTEMQGSYSLREIFVSGGDRADILAGSAQAGYALVGQDTRRRPEGTWKPLAADW